MKANEVMIGDWVIGGSGEPFKIGIIEPDFLYWNEVQPIPLTPEILEKNGIKWLCTEPSGRKTYCCNEPVVQCTYIPNSGWLINVGACGSIKVRFVEISKIQYVHEFQHALKLCVIEKEIEL